MKRLLVLMLTVCITIGMVTPDTVMGATTNTEVTYLEDGTYVTTEITTFSNARSSQVSGYKELCGYTSEGGDMLWKITLYGTFSYDGSEAWCTSASHRISIYVGYIAITDVVSYPYEDCALLDGYSEYYTDGVLTSRRYIHAFLACDENGDLY